MAFFDAGIEDGACRRQRAPTQRMPIGEFGTYPPLVGKLSLGVWPEDIEVGAATRGASMGTVYAVDNRGFERAFQVERRRGSFRKVVPLRQCLQAGRRLLVPHPQRCGFLFDAATGGRISHAGVHGA